MRLLIPASILALLCVAAAARLPATAGHACPTSAGMADKSKHTKPSSFAPHAKAAHNAYGAPVGAKILTKRPPKKKPAHA